MSRKITFVLNKLVRDKVYDNMLSAGQEIDSHVVDDVDKKQVLLGKLAEEVEELRSGDDDSPADLGSVLIAYAKLQGYTIESLLEAVREREQKRGAFDNWHYIKSVTLEADDPWVEYYRKDPSRFIEASDGD